MNLLRKISIHLCAFIICTVIPMVAFADAFVHMATPDNTTGNLTRIDNPLTNNQPEIALFVSPSAERPQGQLFPIKNDHPLAVAYADGFWHVQNSDGSAIANGVTFNVLALPRDYPGIIVHQKEVVLLFRPVCSLAKVDQGFISGC